MKGRKKLQKRSVQKTADTTSDLIDNKIAGTAENWKISKTASSKADEKELEISSKWQEKDTYHQKKRQQIID